MAVTAALMSACATPEREPSRGLLSIRQAFQLALKTRHEVEIPLDVALLMAVTSYDLSRATLEPNERDQYGALYSAATEEARAALFDAASRPFEAVVTTSSGVQAAAYSDDGRFLYTRHTDGVLAKLDLQTRHSWDVSETSREADAFRSRQPRTLPPMRFAGEGVSRALVDGGRSLAVLDSDGGLHLWNIATKRLIETLEPPRSLEDRFALAVSSDGRRLVMVTKSGDLDLWDVVERRKVYDARDDRPFSSSVYRPVSAAVMARDGRTVALVGSDSSVNRGLGGTFGTSDRGLIVIRQLVPPEDSTDPRRVEFDRAINPTTAMNRNDWNADQSMRRVCDIVGRSLTPREWEEYVNTTSSSGELVGIRADLAYVEVCARNRSE